MEFDSKEKFSQEIEKVKEVSKKKQVFLFVLFVILFLGSVISVNYFVNPYEVFKPNFGFEDKYDGELDRELLYPKMKMLKKNDYEVAICGSSSVMINIDESLLKKHFPYTKTYKLAVPVISFFEQYDAISHFVKLNPEVKKIFVSVDFSEGTKCLNINLLPKYSGDWLNIRELYLLLLSEQTLHYSWENIRETFYRNVFLPTIFDMKGSNFWRKFKYVREFREKILDDHNRFPKARFTDWNEKTLLLPLFDELKRIKDFCDEHNVEIVFYTTPAHAFTLYDIKYQGVYEEMENFKREFAKITPFYDFLYVSEFSTEPVSVENKYWIDAAHADIPLGDELLKTIADGNGTYGRYVTTENIENYLKIDRKNLADYSEKYAKELKKFTSYGHMEKPDYEIRYRYE